MNIVQRVRDILLEPRRTWSEIAVETTDTATLFRQYVALLAAIPPVAAFVGTSVFGVSALGMSIRVPLLTGLANLIVGYVLSLLALYVLGLLAAALAPHFGGRQDARQALQLVAYSSTASMVAGVLAIVPSLAALSILGSLYSLYLLYLGAPTLMQTAEGKTLPYTVVLAIGNLVASVVIATTTAVLR